MRRLALFFCLLALLAVPIGAGQAPATQVVPGIWELSPSPATVPDAGSYLCVKRGVLLELLCPEIGPDVAGAEDARLHVNNDGGGNHNIQARAVLQGDGLTSGGFTLRLIDVAGYTDADVPCDQWHWRFVNAPGLEGDPVPVAKAGEAGIAALLDVPGDLEFEHPVRGVRRMPYRLSVAFNGSSAVVPLAEASALLAEGYSNLLLLARSTNACYTPAPALWTTGTCGELHMQASDHSLDLANGGSCSGLGH